MRRFTITSWTFCLALGVAIGLRGETLVAEELIVSPNLANQLRYLHVSIASGRITAAGTFSGRNLESQSQTNGRREKLTVDLTGSLPSVHYELTTPTLHVTLELEQGDTLRVVRAPQGDGTVPYLELNQPAEGKITVVVGRDAAKKTYAVDTWWHLLAAEPDFARTEIEPLLRLLRPGWPLASAGHEIVESLYRKIDAERTYDRRAWSVLVERLSGGKYVERVEADRQLRELGQVVIPYLRNLNEKQLDAEQTYRIRMIVRSYGATADEDTPDSAAQALAADPEMWYALAVRAVGPQRIKVRTQLSLILGEPVTLDVDVDEAAYSVQLAKLRERIDRAVQAAAKP
jgi:hypothetical protein